MLHKLQSNNNNNKFNRDTFETNNNKESLSFSEDNGVNPMAR